MKKIFYMGKEYAGFTDNAMDMTNPKIDLASYGTSPTSGGTTTKVVTTSGGNFERVNGAYVVVTFTNANTGSVSLNVDSTGSKYAYYNGSRLNASNGNFSAGETVTFMYDGTYYQRLDTDTDDTSILKSLANLGWSDVLSSGLLIVKKLFAKMLSQTSDRFRGVDPSRVINYGTATITPSRDGVWVIGGTVSQGNPLPIMYIKCSGQIVSAVVGSQFAGDYAIGCIPVKKGVTYTVEAYRVSIQTSLVYY